MPTHGRVVTLRAESAGADKRFLSAWVDEGGALHVDGQDLGPGTASVSGDGEYEWFQTIEARDVPRLIEALGGEPTVEVLTLLEERFTGEGSYALERILRESGVPVKRSVWSG